MDKVRKISLFIMVALTAAFIYSSFKLATEMQGTIGYVSDETWYVPSSRNILREVFNVQPSYIGADGGYHYSLFFYTYSYMNETEREFGDLLREEYNGYIYMKYNKTPALAVVTYKPLDFEAVKKAFVGVKMIQAGYHYPDNQGIEDYMNSEHPPLVKYMIGFFMMIFGDKPIVWRMPSIIMGTLTLILICLIVMKIINNEILVLLIFLFVFVDSIFMAMTSIAMLDIYVAFFSTLSAWLALRKNYFLSTVAIGLSASAKLTGVFPVMALLLLMLILRVGIIRSILYSTVVSLATWVSVNVPLILRWGFQTWVSQVEGGLKWHVSSRPEGPPASTPWGWLYNENPFSLNFKPDVIAKVDPVIYIMALIMLIFVPYLYWRGRKGYLVPALWFVSSFLGYSAVYAAGNRTLYSFYAITLSPTVYVLAVLLVYALSEPRIFKDALKMYASSLRRPKPTPAQGSEKLGQE
ncbi:MAG: glycosyltransferase family 39 protein [Nitrososphaeria archaeon]